MGVLSFARHWGAAPYAKSLIFLKDLPHSLNQKGAPANRRAPVLFMK